ncbi:MAG: hypothetical protein ACRCTQ_05035 [Brevinemataceae bacterium]
MFLLLIVILSFHTAVVYTQENTNDAIPLGATIDAEKEIAQNYRPGLSFDSSPVSTSLSLKNLLQSSTIKTETSMVGRHGAIRIDGAASLPLLGIDGFVIKDPSINQGQIKVELLPFDFSERADIYKQNLVPYGISAGSFIDFRIPLHYKDSFSIQMKGGTVGSFYSKLQGEKTFSNGSTLLGIVTDNLFKDYYYAVNGGKNFDFYPHSTYQRYAVLSKTRWKNLEFLIANTYTKSFGETGDLNYEVMDLTRNNFISGIKYHHQDWFFQANYTFYNHFIEYNSGVTNEYNAHNVNVYTGIQKQSGRFRYQVLGGYQLQTVEDGMRANSSNYLSSPPFGEQYFNLQGDVTIDLVNPKANKNYNVEMNIALNQILSIYGKYVPVPNLSFGFRHRNGLYGSIYVNRIYLVPDFSTAYGFGLQNGEIPPYLDPKDGIRTGTEFGWNGFMSRVFARFSYAWLDKSFKLSENNTVINNENIRNYSAEIGTSYKSFYQNNIIEISGSASFNYEVDEQNNWASLIPIWKLVTVLSAYNAENTWQTTLIYRFEYLVPNTSPGYLDKKPRHYLDMHIKYKWFFLNILNIANQSYRPIPENTYSPYNPGIRAEVGFEYKFN